MNPVAFTFFNVEIRWYGILIALAILIGAFLFIKRIKKVGIDENSAFDIIIVIIPAAIIGARLYYVLFNLDSYHTIKEVINIRHGGLAIHGALIFSFLAGYSICKIKKLPFRQLCDLAIPSVALGQSIGRWGNYINGEAHGGHTDLPWAINVDGEMVHPTFLYESIWCLCLFIFLLWFDYIRNKNDTTVNFHGQLTLIYMVLYSIERFFVEGLRTDSLMIGNFRQAQILSLLVIIVAGLIYLRLRSKKLQ